MGGSGGYCIVLYELTDWNFEFRKRQIFEKLSDR